MKQATIEDGSAALGFRSVGRRWPPRLDRMAPHQVDNPRPELSHAVGAFARRLYEPCAAVLRFMRESGDPELISRQREIGVRRLQLLSDLGPQLEQTGRLRPGLSGRQAIDLVWAMAGPEVYEELVLDRGWTPQQFENWLGPAVVGLILEA